MRPIRDDTVEWYSRGGIMVTENYGFMLRWERSKVCSRALPPASGSQRPNQAMQLTAVSFAINV
jgi:hypothetical protein